jgi:hypothetical protein
MQLLLFSFFLFVECFYSYSSFFHRCRDEKQHEEFRQLCALSSVSVSADGKKLVAQVTELAGLIVVIRVLIHIYNIGGLPRPKG